MTRTILLLIALGTTLAAQHTPKLLLTPQRLRRLERDRDRQTERWLNFKQRLDTVPNSPDRGFELALDYAVTKDQTKGREALAWAASHSCEQRQVALILDWTGDLRTDAESESLLHTNCPPTGGPFAQMRDRLFRAVEAADDISPSDVHINTVPGADELYALVEYLDVYRNTEAEDLRTQNRIFFSQLPQMYLLSFPPAQLPHPSWQQHIAALALVSLDPNLEGSQFLQGWAMENRFTSGAGPGAAYEFLWANPYLPGIGYQDMQPWVYQQASSLLLARTDWNPDACWVQVSPRGKQQQNCPAAWETKPTVFGILRLIPLTEHCVAVTPQDKPPLLLLTESPSTVTYPENGHKATATTDAAGIWQIPAALNGKVCLSKH